MNPHNVNLAVLEGQGDRAEDVFNLDRGEFHGTAFCVAPHLFLTAAHVYEAASARGAQVAVARLTPGRVQVQTVRNVDVFPDVDVALLQCPNLWAEILPFNFNPLYYLTDVAAMGFAFGLELAGIEGEPHVHQLRAFKGHVVTRRGLTHLNGVPPGYELSFDAPPGLSGAPLLLPQGDNPLVTGMILEHHKAELDDRSMVLGLAIDAEELLTLQSGFLGGSFAEIIFHRPRLPPRNRQR